MKKIVLMTFGLLMSLLVSAQSDDCSGAVTLTVNTSCSYTTFTNNENGQPEAGTPNPSCLAGTESSDVWYKFTGDGTALQVTLANSNRRSTVAVWTNCPATTEVACMDVALGATGSMNVNTTSGTTYYIQIIRTSGNSNADQSGDICVSKPGYTMTNGSITACSGTFYDSGGSAGDYGYDENYTFTICPGTAGAKTKVVFSSFDIEDSYEYLEIFDGTSTSATSLGVYTGAYGPGTVQASSSNSSGCLTFRFTSDDLYNYSGWEAAISCIQPCQTITANWVSSNEAPMSDGVIRICQGQSVNFVGSGTFSSSGTGATYTWTFGDGATANGTNVNHTYSAAGSYFVNLKITDPSGCTNSNAFNRNVQVSTTPTITTAASPTSLCAGQTSNLSANVTMNTYTQNCTPPVSGTTFLPDGSGASYQTSINVNCYSSSATVTSTSDITSVCLNMEHSYPGDLSISLTCPNGQTINLIDYDFNSLGSANLGIPWATASIDGNSSNTTPGTGYDYCFSPTATATMDGSIQTGGTFPNGSGGTYTDSYIPAGTYQSSDDFSGLIGCPLDGSWTITVTDHLTLDNGYIFNWDVNFNSSLVSAPSFTPTIASQGWQATTGLVSTGSTTATVTPTSTGTPCYNYQVTDNFGCTYTQPQCITVSCTVLPVGLISFDAEPVDEQYVHVFWKTSGEFENDYFRVQRSSNGIDWTDLGTVAGSGNSDGINLYEYNDFMPLIGVSYYRLVQVDFNGSETTYDPKAVNLSQIPEGDLLVYPNPTKQSVTLTGDIHSLDDIVIMNLVGKVINQQCAMTLQQDGSVLIDLGTVSQGVYLIRKGNQTVSLTKE